MRYCGFSKGLHDLEHIFTFSNVRWGGCDAPAPQESILNSENSYTVSDTHQSQSEHPSFGLQELLIHQHNLYEREESTSI